MIDQQAEAEEWRPIQGADPGYEVSNLGRVRSWRKRGRQNGRPRSVPVLLRPTPQGRGHLQVAVNVEGRSRPRLVAHLVLEAFVGPRQGGGQCRRADGDRGNNRVENLRWRVRTDT